MMVFQEKDIDFAKLDWLRFEELCFDLLMKYKFHDMVWHQGGSDGGRDIEGTFTVINSLTGAYHEKWFFKCKFYSSGIPMDLMVSKIGWATAHRIKHFVLMTNTHPTKSTRDYLNLSQASANFKIHIIDGKYLKKHLLLFPDLVVKYFADDTVIWVKSLVKQWLFHDTLPDVKTLYKLSLVVDPRKLNREELVFLFLAFETSDYDEEFLEDGVERFSFNFLGKEIKRYKNLDYPIDLKSETGMIDAKWSHFSLQTSRITGTDNTLILYQDLENKENLQILLYRQQSQITVKVSFKNR
jgi:hypothetical protein